MQCKCFLFHRKLDISSTLQTIFSQMLFSGFIRYSQETFLPLHNTSFLFLPSPGGRSLPRSLLGSTAGCDLEGGVFAVPTTLPPNSSRHNRMFSPNKEAELAFRQQLDSINVRQSKASLNWYIVHRNICPNINRHFLSSQMQSDLFLSRQRKPRNRQLRKPLVVQVN